MKPFHSGACMRCALVAVLLAAPPFMASAGASVLEGRQLRSNSVISQDLHVLAAREAGCRGVPSSAQVAPGEAEMVTGADGIMMVDGRVTVVIGSMTPSALVPELEALGMTNFFVHDDLNHLRGDIALEDLFLLENLKGHGLLRVQAEHWPQTSIGNVTSQADWLHEANRVRASLGGYTGAGQRIGTLSDSYNRLGGAAAGVLSGDLPAVMTILQEGPSSGTIDEGRGMVELIYDLAPGAAYSFATAFVGGQSGFANNIRALAANTAQGQATVIVDDVFYFREPYFQDGVIAQAINEVVTTRNAVYFSAAGNLADQSYERTTPNFVTSAVAQANGASFGFLGGTPPTLWTWLDYDPGEGIAPSQTVTLPGQRTATLGLQWDDPFYLPLSVENDLDIFVTSSNSASLLGVSAEENRGTTEPGELAQWSNVSGSPVTYRIYIGRWIGNPGGSVGSGPTRLKWVNFGANGGGGFTSISFGTQSSTITPHSAAVNAISVGAVNSFAQNSFADFTSKGPATILFAANGTRLGAPVVRNKPDFAALQGTNTTFFLGNDFEPDGFPNFFGTSAAAPHAAAIAALVRQRFPAETPAQIYQRIRNSADPFENPGNRVGDGLINAWESVYGDPVPATIPYSTGFETGYLDNEWRTRRTQAGRTSVTNQVPQAGLRHLTLDSTLSGSNGRGEATLHVDVSGFNNVTLSFQHRRGTSEANHAMPATFVDGSNTDGVAYSLDGVNWKRIVSLTSGNSTTTYQPFNFNLSSILFLFS